MDVLLGGADFIRRRQASHSAGVAGHSQRFGRTREEILHWLEDAGYRSFGLINGRWRDLPLAGTATSWRCRS